MLAVAAGQFGMLWIVGWSSPEYFFESGQWVVPISDYWTVNAMKCFVHASDLLSGQWRV